MLNQGELDGKGVFPEKIAELNDLISESIELLLQAGQQILDIDLDDSFDENSLESIRVLNGNLSQSLILKVTSAAELLGVINLRPFQLSLHRHHARLQMSNGNNDLAEQNFLMALDCARESKSLMDEANILKDLAGFYEARNETEAAKQYCQKALALATELGIPLKAEWEALQQFLGGGDGP